MAVTLAGVAPGWLWPARCLGVGYEVSYIGLIFASTPVLSGKANLNM